MLFDFRNTLLIFVVAFAYTGLATLAIEMFVLPVLLPQLHAGHGLMVGHDSVGFNAMASEMATRVQTYGWKEWSLAPNLQGVVGITAAVYALTGVHEPYVLIPIYAALYALATACVYRIILAASGSEGGARLAAAAFLLFPSATMIYADLHKDAWSCAGILLFLAAWVEVEGRKTDSWPALLGLVVICGLAVALLWVVRPYLIKLALGGATLGLIAAIVANAVTANQWRRDIRRYVSYLTVLGIMASISFTSSAPLMDAPLRAPTFIVKSEKAASPAGPAGVDTPTAVAETAPAPLATPNPFIKHTVGAILAVREGVLTTPGGSVIDKDVRFPSLRDVALYIPRALQIGLLAPFPNMWLDRGMTAGARMMRLVSGAEMTVCYVLLLGYLFFIPSIPRRRIALCLFLAVTCLSVIGVMSVAMPNVGTLYRMRYPFFMLIVGLGAAGWVILLTKIRARRRFARAI